MFLYNVSITKSSIFHSRKGAVKNSFLYDSVHFLLHFKTNNVNKIKTPFWFSFNKSNIVSVKSNNYGSGDFNHVFSLLDSPQLKGVVSDIYLFTTPSVFGSVFNPVSFWLMCQDSKILFFMAEVNNTFGGRMYYHHFGTPHVDLNSILISKKEFFVSPFQKLEGEYHFNIKEFTESKINVIIDYCNNSSGNLYSGLFTSVKGNIKPLILNDIFLIFKNSWMGKFRTITLILYQALKLKIKKVPFENYK